MTNSELEKFRSMFEDYSDYICKRNPDSLLARIYGIYTVSMLDHTPVHLILMGNTIQIKDKEFIENKFDLKGSIIKRKVNGKIKNTSTLKDVNLLDIRKEKLVRFRPLILIAIEI